MSDVTPALPTPLISLKLTAILLAITTFIMAASFALGTGPFFGSSSYFNASFAPSVLALVMLVLFAQANDARREVRNAFFVAAFIDMAMIVAFGTSQRFSDSEMAFQAGQKLDIATSNMGHPPQVQAQLRAILESAETTAANRDMVQQISEARFSPETVTQYLVSAESLGMDATFVAQNALVRPQDEQALFRQALLRANAGDQVVANWLSSNAPSTP